MAMPARSRPYVAPVAMATKPPIECPTTTAGPLAPRSSATAITSAAQVDMGYSLRRSLSPWPDRSMAAIR